MSTDTETTPIIEQEQKTTCGEKMKSFFEALKSSAKVKVCIVAATWGLLTGIERAIILPTLWLYFFKLFSTEAAIRYYGVTLAAFNCAILIISPLYGYLAYKGIRVKLLIIVSNQLEIVGNIIYILADQPWLVLFARFVSGLGGGSEVPLYADITRLTTPEERTPYIASLLLARQFGLIIGPACTLFMENMNLKIGKVSISVYNGPGLVMAILWSAHTILTLFIYPRVNKDGGVSETTKMEKLDILDHFYSSPDSKTPEETKVTPETSEGSVDQSDGDNENVRDHTKQIISTDDQPKPQRSCHTLCNYERLHVYMKYETLTILLALFGTYFSLMSLEAVLPPVAASYFKWSEVQTSYVYLACGIMVIFVYLGVRSASKHCKDRVILLIGCGFLIFSYAWTMLVLALMNEHQRDAYIGMILTGIFFHVVGQPFAVCSESLYTKTLPIQDMDVGQSILRTVLNLAILIGPFVGGSMQHVPSGVFAIMLILIVAPTILLVTRFNLFTL